MFMFRPALGVLGFVLVMLSGLMLLPALMVFAGDGENYRAFLVSFSITSVTGLTLLLFFRRTMQNPNPRKMFLITSLCWVGVSFFSSIPLMLSSYPLSVTDALFEAVSGITTTGSTVMTGLDSTSRDLLLWRSLMQWVGGVGVIAMAVGFCLSWASGRCGCSKRNRPTGRTRSWPAAVISSAIFSSPTWSYRSPARVITMSSA